MKNFKKLTTCLLAACAVLLVQACCTPAATAAPQQAACDSCDTFVSGGPGGLLRGGCDGTCNGACDGSCAGGRRGLLRNRNVCCPECDGCFNEAQCTLKIESVEEEKTCFEVDYKTICIPKVCPPWKQNNRRVFCGDNGCDGTCGGTCDGAGCDSRGCRGCDGGGCASCCVPSSPCAEARSVKILVTKKYKCPACKCKWEAVSADCSAAPAPAPAADAQSSMWNNQTQPQAPVTPSLGAYYQGNQATIQQAPVQPAPGQQLIPRNISAPQNSAPPIIRQQPVQPTQPIITPTQQNRQGTSFSLKDNAGR